MAQSNKKNKTLVEQLNAGFSPLIKAYETFKSELKRKNIPVQLGSQKDGGVVMDARGLMILKQVKNADGSPALDKDGKQSYQPQEIKGVREKGLGDGTSGPVYSRPGQAQRVSPLLAMRSYTGLNYSMIRAIQDELAGIQWQFFIIDAKTKEHNEVFEHELLDLLDGVNEYMTGPELRSVIGAQLELVGNVYLLFLNDKGDAVSSYDEKPTQMHPMDPSMVDVMLDKTIYPFKIMGYRLSVEGRKIQYKPFQVLHLKSIDPSNPYVGIGTTQAIAEWIDVDNYAMEFNRQFFLHGTYLTGWMETEMVGEDQIESLSESWQEQHAGVQNSNKIFFAPKGVKFHEGVTIKDMAFDKLLDKTRERILAGGRVGKTILGTAESDTNRATAETADYVFAKRKIKPMMTMICSFINEYLTPRFEANGYITFKDPTPEDKSFRIQEMQSMAGNQPVMSVNELRDHYAGLGDIEGGDTVQKPGMMVDVGAVKPTPEGEPKKEPKGMLLKSDEYAYHPTRVRFNKNMAVRKDAAKALAEKIVEAMQKIKAQKPWKLSHDDYAVAQKTAEKRTADAQKELRDEIVKFNHRQEVEVIKNLPRIIENSKAVNPLDIFDMKKWIDVMIDLSTPILSTLAKSEGTAAAESIIGSGVDVMTNPNYKSALDQAIGLFSTSYNQDVMDSLKANIEENLKTGASYADLSKGVQQIYAWQDGYKADRVAKTETFRVQNSAMKEAWKQTGVVKSMKWYTSPHDNVCQFCQAMDGKVIPIDQNFFDKGDAITVGEDTMNLDYSDIGGPPLHPNCACSLQPEDVSIE